MISGKSPKLLLKLLAVALLLTAASRPADAESRRALIIGINKYEMSGLTVLRGEPQLPLKWPDLEGAVNDAYRVRDLLISRYGFKREDIVLLTDGDANRQSILDAMNQQLVAPAKNGDLSFFYFAGHGSRVRNTLSREHDRLDESIVPADVMKGVRDIRDKELRDVFNKILDRGAQLVAIFDSCHSGSVSRGLAGDAPYRTRLLPIDPRDVKDGSTASNPWERGALILSAAQDGELANEDEDEFKKAGGRFTIALAKVARSAPKDEPVLFLFRRVQGAMRNRGSNQEPALEAVEARKKQPLLGGFSTDSGSVTAAVQQIKDGLVILQEGLGAGLTKGSELTRSGDEMIRLRIERVDGISRSYASIISGSESSINPGDLFVVTTAAAPDEPNLRVWIPKSDLTAGQLKALHEDVQLAIKAKGYTSVVDPAKQKPTYVVQFASDKWLLTGPTGEPESLGANLGAASLAKRLPSLASGSASLYLMLPAPIDLDKQLALGQETRNNAIERGDRLKSDYYLMGSVDGDQLKYSWVRPWLDAPQASTLPLETDWVIASGTNAGNQLTALALKLGFINAWLRIEGSSTGQPFPYRLMLQESESTHRVDQGNIIDGQAFELALVSDRQNISPQSWRFVFVYAIDSNGKMTLLFPRAGGVENRFPPEHDANPAQSYLLENGGFKVSEPFGMDTYVMISSSDQLSNPEMLESSGVVTTRSSENTLSALLKGIGASSRGLTPQAIPSRWSIDRISVQSVPKPR